MRWRVIFLGLVLGLLVVGLATPGLAQPADDERELSDLKPNGVLPDEEAPDSMRWLSDYGSATIRYTPVGPFSQDWRYLEPDAVVHRNRVTLRTVRMGTASQLNEKLNVTVVSWQKGTKTVHRGNETVEVPTAVNVSSQTQRVNLDRGYSTTSISLPSHYDEAYEITMWIEEYPHARWRFTHESIRSAQPLADPLNTQDEAWGYVGKIALIPGGIGIVLGLFLSRRTLKRTGTGPRIGTGVWAIGLLILAGILLGAAYYQTAAIIAYVPQLLGLLLGIIAYAGGLVMGPSIEKIAFERLETTDALALRNREAPGGQKATDGGQAVAEPGGVTDTPDSLTPPTPDNEDAEPKSASDPKMLEIDDDDYREELYRDMPQKPVVRDEDGSRFIPKRGIRPWLARLFADPAKLDISELRTRIRVQEGPIDEVIMTDPEDDEAVHHQPARLERRWPVWHDVDEDADRVEKAVKGLMTLGIVVGIPLVGIELGSMFLGLPSVGFLAGVVPVGIAAYTAKDGWIDFDPAPIHMRSANATLTMLQTEYRDAKLLEEFEEIAWSERQRTAMEARDVERRRDETLIHEQFGDLDVDEPVNSVRDNDDGGDSDDE